MKMLLKGAIILLLSSIFLTSGSAQKLILPDLDSFKKESSHPVYTPDDLWDYINGGADSYVALGFEDLTIIEYTRGKKVSVKLELYRHSDEQMAFGIYALERAPSYKFNDTGVQGYKGEGYFNFFKGSYYIKIYTHSKSKKAIAAVNQLAAEVDMLLEGSESFPEIINLFPKEGKKDNEEMFISENVIGHGFLSNAFRCSYSVKGNDFYLYLFNCDNKTEIEEMVQTYLKRQDLDTDKSDEGKSAFKDGYNGDIFLAWKGTRMVLITGLESGDTSFAEKYISLVLK